MSALEKFMVKANPQEVELRIELEFQYEWERDVQFTIEDESGSLGITMVEDIDHTLRVTAHEFGECYLNSEEQEALFFTLREILLDDEVLTRKEVFTDPDSPVGSVTEPLEEANDDRIVRMPEEKKVDAPRGLEPEEIAALSENQGETLKNVLAHRLDTRPELEPWLVMLLIERGYIIRKAE